MKHLILVRHSFAEGTSSGTTDFDRSLTGQGKEHAFKQVKKMFSNGIVPDFLISSDAKRALQTATIFSEVLGMKNVHKESFLYTEYTTNQFLNFLHTIPKDISTLLVVGHNPNITNMAYRLVEDFKHAFAPGNIAVIGFELDDWKTIQLQSGNLKHWF